MSRLLSAALFLVLVQASSTKGWATKEEDDFMKDCITNSSCGGQEIRFPFRLQSRPQYCGAPGLEVSCSSAGEAMLTLPRIGPCKLTSIDYSSAGITVELGESWIPCPLQKLISVNLTNPIHMYEIYNSSFTLVRCAQEIPTTDLSWIAGPISCLAIDGQFVYAASPSASMDKVSPHCSTTGNDSAIPDSFGQIFGELVQNFIRSRQISARVTVPEAAACAECENQGQYCGFNRATNQNFCIDTVRQPGGRSKKFVIGLSAGGCIALVLVALILFYLIRKSNKDQRTRLKVEKFLATYGDAKPTRYTFAQVKRITKRFKNKLGQGGYGSVYKGELPNGVPVAVKMLERSKGEGEEFINEVATIGRIHHTNIVRLLGFCSERSTRALIYEFMSNESLEKYIFSREDTHSRLGMDKSLNIAIGVARGIEYLHQGCQHRILHFDIKPHNILLDQEFNPKISDFGLAKLCSREQSIVTMTAARGTMGYIAPEMYSRNFGTVSYKSDVYSFGMLVLEMVGGRKNLDPEIGKESEIYFPEWVYDKLLNMQDLMEVEGKDQEIAKKLAMVALWCIQWSPLDRPAMSRVLQMLIGSVESLPMPPKPFVSLLDQASISVDVIN